MDITKDIVDYIALLARLELEGKEKELLANDLNSILRYMDKLNELDTKGVEPLSHVLPVNNRFRDDIIDESFIEISNNRFQTGYLEIYNLTGQLIYREEMNNPEVIKISRSLFKSAGIYVVSIKTTNYSFNKKLVVK